MNSRSGRSVIVTGGTSGIGFAAVSQLLAAGDNVTVGDLVEGRLPELRAVSEREGAGSLHFLKTDISDEAAVKHLVDAASKRFGNLGAAINCAAYPPRHVLLHQMGREQWDKSQAINLSGAFFCLKYQISAMLESGGGAIVVISSVASVISGTPGHADYCSAKSGINGLVRAAARDYAAVGVRVNAVLPGATLTPMFREVNTSEKVVNDTIAMIPLHRLGDPSEIAAAAVWLISEQASYVTGISMPVDGGLVGCA